MVTISQGNTSQYRLGGNIFAQDADQFIDRVVNAVKQFTDADGIVITTSKAAQEFNRDDD